MAPSDELPGRSSSIQPKPPVQPQGINIDDRRDSDSEFMNDILASIQAHYGETSIRAKFQDYVFRFVRLAALYEEQVYGETHIGWNSEKNVLGYGPVFADDLAQQKELNAYANRIEGWRQTISYKYYQRVRLYQGNGCYTETSFAIGYQALAGKLLY